MSLHTRLVTSTGDLDGAVVRQVIHEVMSGTLSEDDSQALQPVLSGGILTVELEEDDSYELDVVEYADAEEELIKGFFGRSMTSGYDGWDALNFGFPEWYLLRTYGSDETDGEYVDPGDNFEKLFQEKQLDWIQEGNWSSSALTEFSARDLTEPWLLRELAEYNDLWGTNDIFTDSDVKNGDAIPDELVDIATTFWDFAVHNEPNDNPVAFGLWASQSSDFDDWLANHTPYWRDNDQPLSQDESSGLRTACLRLGMLETRLYSL